ncbi:MAG: hypothetical protein ACREMO_04630 [Gemmatimonadales bacterium]
MQVLPCALFLASATTTLALVPCEAQDAESYEAATADSTGLLSIRVSAQHTIVPPRDSGQVGIDQVAISPDRHAVGWLVLYLNCCTSYPIPLTLKVYARGTLRSFTGIDLPVWRWRFEGGGKQVAFYQETVHGGIGAHYELRDVRSGRLVGQYQPSDSTPAPPWVARLTAVPADSSH